MVVIFVTEHFSLEKGQASSEPERVKHSCVKRKTRCLEQLILQLGSRFTHHVTQITFLAEFGILIRPMLARSTLADLAILQGSPGVAAAHLLVLEQSGKQRH